MSLEIAIVLARSFAAEISAAMTYGIGPTAGWSARTSRFSEANSPVAPYPANQTKSKAYAGSVGGFRGVLCHLVGTTGWEFSCQYDKDG